MSKRKTNDNKRKLRLHKIARDKDSRIHLQRIHKFPLKRASEIDALKRTSVTFIETVLRHHRRKHTLPQGVDNAFPRANNFKMFEPPGTQPQTFERELRWLHARFGVNETSLNNLLLKRREYSTAIVLGHFDTAEAILSTTRNLFGISTWIIESELLLAELRGGFAANRTQLAAIMRQSLPHNVLLQAEYASQRVDSLFSPRQYQQAIADFASDPLYRTDTPLLPSYLSFLFTPQMLLTQKITEEEAAFILFTDSSRAIIDAYCAYLKLLRHMLVMNGHAIPYAPEHSLHLSRLRDPETYALQLLLCGSSPTTETKELSELRHRLNTGDLDAAIHISSRKIAEDPLVFEWYEVLASASAQRRDQVPECLSKDSPGFHLLRTLRQFFECNDSFGESLVSLQRLGVAFDTTPLSSQIISFLYKTVHQPVMNRHWSQAIYGLSPNTQFIPLLPRLTARITLNHVNLHFEPSDRKIATAICDWALQYRREPNTLLLSRAATDAICAEIHMQSGRPAMALPLYQRTIASPPHALALAEAVRGAIRCHLDLEQVHEGILLLADTQLSPISIMHLFDIKLLAGQYRAFDRHFDKTSIAWPLLHFMNYALGNARRSDIYLSYAIFMDTTGFCRPSELAKSASRMSYGASQLRMFLHMVCHQSIIDSSGVWDGSEDLDLERINICQALQEMDEDNSKMYAEEISQIQQNLAVSRALKHVANSKLHFNLEGIERALDPTFHQRLERYITTPHLQYGSRVAFELQWTKQTQSAEIDDKAPNNLFRDLLYTIRHVFLFSNEHGLDSFLSSRIRHQTIKGALRAIFERNALVTEKRDDVYVMNTHWDQEMSGTTEEVRCTLQSCLSEFSSAVDALIDMVHRDWMRIRSAPGCDQGLFVVDFQDEEVLLFESQMRGISERYQFIDAVFSKLRQRLTLCLVNIRQKLKDELREAFESALERFQRSAEERGVVLAPAIANAVIHCRTDIQNGINEIAEWFKLEDSGELEDFSVRTLIAASIENIKNCFCLSKFECSVECPDEVVIAGRHFTALWYALFQVLENVVRYAGSESAKATMFVGVRQGKLTIEIQNPLGNDQDELSVSARLAEINNYSPEVIRRESGSGFAKLKNILRNELEQDEPDVVLFVASNVFTTRISMTTDGILA